MKLTSPRLMQSQSRPELLFCYDRTLKSAPPCAHSYFKGISAAKGSRCCYTELKYLAPFCFPLRITSIEISFLLKKAHTITVSLPIFYLKHILFPLHILVIVCSTNRGRQD